MAVKLNEINDGKVLEVQMSGKLARADYERFVPEFERLLKQQGKLRVLCDMEDFHGWEAGALWEDIKFDLKHFSDIERLAMVGDKKWEKGMAAFCKPFTSAKIRYFDRAAMSEARSWVSNSPSTATTT
jgi:tRNA G46 methylase TrmB